MEHWNSDSLMTIFKDENHESTESENMVVVPAFDHPSNREDPTNEVVQNDFNFPEEATKLLIDYRIELEALFRDCGDVLWLATLIWDEIASKLSQHGFQISGNECLRKWKKLRKEYADTVKNLGRSHDDVWEYFHKFETVYKEQENECKTQTDATETLEGILSTFEPGFENELKINYEIGGNYLMNETEGRFNDIDSVIANVVTENEAEDAVKFIETLNSAEIENTENEMIYTNIDNFNYRIPESAWNYVPLKRTESPWNQNTTQCFLDLRLYVEKIQRSGQHFTKTVNIYVSNKMAYYGYKIPAEVCKLKWQNFKKYYKRETQLLKQNGHGRTVWEYFWQMDKVFNASGLSDRTTERSEFIWTKEAVEMLIKLRLPMEKAFRTYGAYITLWQDVASRMAANNFLVKFHECSTKWLELSGMHGECMECVKKDDSNVRWDLLKENQLPINTSPQSCANFAHARNSIEKKKKKSRKHIEPVTLYKFEWEREEGATKMLIMLKLQLETSIKNSQMDKSLLWNEIAKIMQSRGYKVHPVSCKSRWYHLMTLYYVEYMDGIESTCPEYRECFQLIDTIFKKVPEITETPVIELKAMDSRNGELLPDLEDGKRSFVWTDEGIKMLIKLRFTKTDQTATRRYMKWISNQMQCAGFNVSHVDCYKKWERMHSTYKKCRLRLVQGVSPKWPYFDLIDQHFKELKKDSELLEAGGDEMKLFFAWPRDAVRGLIQHRMSLEVEFNTLSHRKDITCLWTRIADMLANEGFKVSRTECIAKWICLKESYDKTKKELRSGNGAIIGEYFLQIDEGMRKINQSRSRKKSSNETVTAHPKILIDLIDDEILANMGRPINEEAKKSYDAEYTNSRQIIDSDENAVPVNKSNATMNGKVNWIQSTTDTVTRRIPSDYITVRPLIKECKKLIDSAYTSANQDIDTDKNTVLEKKNTISTHEEANLIHSITDFNKNSTVSKYIKILPSLKESHESTNAENTNRKKSIVDFTENGTTSIRQKNYANPNEGSINPNDVNGKFTNSIGTINAERNYCSASADTKRTSVKSRRIAHKWCKEATEILIDLKLEHEIRHPGSPRNVVMWDKIAADIKLLGYNYTFVECRHKWYRLLNVYKQKIEDMQLHRRTRKWQYFDRLDSLFKCGTEYYRRGFRWLPRKVLVQSDDE